MDCTTNVFATPHWANARTLIEDKTGTQGHVQQTSHNAHNAECMRCQRIMFIAMNQIVLSLQFGIVITFPTRPRMTGTEYTPEHCHARTRLKFTPNLCSYLK